MVAPRIAALEAAMRVKSLPVMPKRASLYYISHMAPVGRRTTYMVSGVRCCGLRSEVNSDDPELACLHWKLPVRL